MWHIHETVNNHAIWAVIDNIKNIFSEIWENLKQWSKIVWFKFNEKEPVEIIDNNLVISWVLDGATINIRYNLLSGQLYMNSFVDESKWARPVITVWNTEANKPIWLFIPYKDILDNYYQPTNNINNFQNVLRQKIENVGDIVQKDIKSQSKKNSVVSKFLRTFNILKDGWSNPPLYFEGWWNLFDALQCINNSDSATLDKFQDFMYYMMEEYAGLKRWKNNESQKQDWSDKIFTHGTNEDKINEDEVDKDGKLFIDKMGQFKDEKVKIGQKNQFWIGDSLWFADIINTKLSQWDPPDKKLSIQKMDSFKKNIDECSTKNILKALDNI